MVAEVAALRAEVSSLRASADDWEQLAIDEQERADHLQFQAGLVPGLKAQIDQMGIALLAAQSRYEKDDTTDTGRWEGLPQLVSGDRESAVDLFRHLEDASNGRVVFTDRAASTWKKCKYPFPGEMAECLIKLARVAEALYQSTGCSYPHLHTWIRENYDLAVSLNDDTIEKDPKKRYF